MDENLQGMILAKLTSIEQTIGQTAVSVARLEERINSSSGEVSDHESRIRSLERWKWGLTGVVTILSGLFGAYAKVNGG